MSKLRLLSAILNWGRQKGRMVKVKGVDRSWKLNWWHDTLAALLSTHPYRYTCMQNSALILWFHMCEVQVYNRLQTRRNSYTHTHTRTREIFLTCVKAEKGEKARVSGEKERGRGKEQTAGMTYANHACTRLLQANQNFPLAVLWRHNR